MPELPEVETTRRGIAPHITGQVIKSIAIRVPRLRWPIPDNLSQKVQGKIVKSVQRRGKYLLLYVPAGAILLHLGMSGSLRLVNPNCQPQTHDHFDLLFTSDFCLRFTDPRRFGAVLWAANDPLQHPLLALMGPEPISAEFSGEYLYQKAQRRQVAVKSFIMDHRIVAGIGNIYANESLFMAGIHPNRAAGRIALARYNKLCICIRQVLSQAIQQGGTTLKDFRNSEGKRGYFQLALQVYGKAGENCPQCARPIYGIRIGQRASFYCGHCQR